MKYNGIVIGSKEQALPVVISTDTAYIHKNIKKLEPTIMIDKPAAELYSYEETEYALQEYLMIMNTSIDETQLALAEMFELVGV